MDVNFGLLEYPQCEFFDELLDVAGPDIIDLIPILEADDGLIGLVLVLDALDDILADHAVQRRLVGMFLSVEGLLGGEIGEVLPDAHIALQAVGAHLVAVLVAIFDEHHAFLELELDKLLIVEDLFQIFLRVVIELHRGGATMMRNSSKGTPSLLLPLFEKNLKSRLIFSFSVDLKILAGWDIAYRCRG